MKKHANLSPAPWWTLAILLILGLVLVVRHRTTPNKHCEVYTSDVFSVADIDTAEVYTWSEWSPLESRIVIDKKEKQITVMCWEDENTRVEVTYDVYETGNWCFEDNGEEWLKMAIKTHKTHSKGFCRLVKTSKGQLQIYFDFPDQGRSIGLGRLKYIG